MSAPRPVKCCPICGKPAVAAYRPFCSPRCADVDLHRWLAGAYVLPGQPLDEAEAGAGETPNVPVVPEPAREE